MLRHVKGCLEDTSPDHIILHHGTNDLRSNNTPDETTDKILNLAASVKTNENQVFICGLVVRNDKLNNKSTEVNELLMDKCVTRHLLLIDHKNINLNMLNRCGLHLNEYGTTRIVNNFCYNMNA